MSSTVESVPGTPEWGTNEGAATVRAAQPNPREGHQQTAADTKLRTARIEDPQRVSGGSSVREKAATEAVRGDA